MITGSTKLLYKGTDGTSRTIDPDNYALKSDMGDYSDMNNELVKYGKDVISNAITDKGIATSSTDSFDTMAINIRNISTSASGTVGEMNIYCQDTQPTAQNGLWIKRNRSEVNNILIKEDYYLEDGVAGDLPINFGTTLHYNDTRYMIIGYKYNNKLYIYYYGGSSSNKAILRIVDLNTYETSIKSASTSIMYSNASCYVYKNYALMLYGTGMYKVQIDSSPDIISSLSYHVYNSSHNVLSGCIFNDKIYVLTQSNSTDSSNYFTKTINVADISNISSTSTITFTNIGLTTSTTYINYTKNKVYMCMYNNTIYCFCGMNLMFTFDLNTNEFIELQQSVSPYGYSSSQSVLGYGFKAGKVFFLGIIDGNITTSKKLTDVAVYDIASNTTSVIKNVFGDNTEGRVSNYTPLYGYCQDENDIFILGGSHTTSNDIKNEAVTKYTIQSNNYDTGTIICQPTAAGDHITTMYSSDLVTLNYGIDAVYYQDTDGFKKQDAAIIKNGIVIDL